MVVCTAGRHGLTDASAYFMEEKMNLFFILFLACGDPDDTASDTEETSEETETEAYIRYH